MHLERCVTRAKILLLFWCTFYFIGLLYFVSALWNLCNSRLVIICFECEMSETLVAHWRIVSLLSQRSVIMQSTRNTVSVLCAYVATANDSYCLSEFSTQNNRRLLVLHLHFIVEYRSLIINYLWRNWAGFPSSAWLWTTPLLPVNENTSISTIYRGKWSKQTKTM